ncbi:T9SS type A sorting domain-containing protein [Kaistella palustris]|uniref:T9SS type A sorting domain-containing protein n=1 Tax=Kaistella palustris TaxID=493376 RepID=UPI00041C8B26|nr:T9SS type A sorting domain-containing protein [Kaistella palustris]
MKKSFLSLVAGFLLFSGIATAQTTTWNFSEWPAQSGYTESTVVNNLGFLPGPSNSSNLMGAIESNTATIDGISFTQRLKTNGGSYTSGETNFAMPSQRAMYFDVNGNSTIKIWYKNGGGGTRTVYITNGTSVLTSFPYTDSTVGQYVTYNYVGGPTKIYITDDQAVNFYQISATNLATTTVLGVTNANKKSSTVYAAGNQVFVSKLSGPATVEVYTMNGALVKTISAKADTSFNLNTGIYIVNVKSGNQTVSQKVSVR